MSTVFGGLEVQLTSTAGALRNLGLAVRMFDPYDREALDRAALLHVFGSDYPVQQMVSLVATMGVPVVVSSVYFPTRVGQLVDRVSGSIPRTAAHFQRLVLRTAGLVLPNSVDEAELIARVHGVPRANLRVIPNGFGEARLGGDGERFRRKYLSQVPTSRPLVLCVARVESRKNTLVLLESARAMNAFLVLLGPPSRSERDFTERVAEECKRRPSDVLWVPGVPSDSTDLADAYAAAHVHVLPSEFETPGLSSLEAGANGCNLVVGRCHPVEEYFHGVATFVQPGSVRELRAGIERALALPRDSMQQASAIRQRFSWEAVARFTAAAYLEVMR